MDNVRYLILWLSLLQNAKKEKIKKKRNKRAYISKTYDLFL